MLDAIVFLVLGVNIVLSIGVYLRNKSGKANQLFAAFVIFLNLWIVANFLENEPKLVGVNNLEFFLRLDFIFAAFMFLSWFYFCSAFAESCLERKEWRWLGLMAVILTVGLSVLCLFTPLILTKVAFTGSVIQFEGGALWLLYAASLLAAGGGGLIILIRARQTAARSGRLIKRRQIDLILMGFIISIGNGVVINFLQAFAAISLEMSRFAIYGVTALVIFTAYAVAVEKLFEVRLILTRSIAFLIMTVLISVLYSALVFVGGVILTNITIDPVLIAISVILTTVVSLSFQTVYGALTELTDRLLFKQDYNASELLGKLTRIIVNTFALDEVGIKILKTLVAQMKLERAALLVVEKGKVTHEQCLGFGKGGCEAGRLVAAARRERGMKEDYFIFENMPDGALKDVFRKLRIAVVTMMKVGEQGVVMLILGQKLSGESYTGKDLEVLDVFAPEAGIAIQKAKAYDRIKRFSEELEQKVIERTAALERSQKRELDKAREVARLKDEFVFLAAHELRNPVVAIKGFLQLLNELEGKFPKRAKGHFEAMAAASKQLEQLVNDLLEVARSEAGTLKVKLEPVSVKEVIRETAGELAPMAKEARVKIGLSLNRERVMALADRVKLKEVVMNLLSNAIKYNRRGGRVMIKTVPEEKKILVMVSDNGVGIPAAEQAKIFSKFFRATTAVKTEAPGTGLGLFITKMLVDRMGGQIEFRSREKEGTTFALTLERIRD